MVTKKKPTRKYKDLPSPPEMRRIDGEDMELLSGNPVIGFLLRSKAEQLAAEWKAYPKGGHARVIEWDDRWWVYGN